MSASSPHVPPPAGRPRVTVPRVAATKVRRGDDPLVMVTAYDVHSGRIADAAGIDILLVGDSLGMVVQGGPDTLRVTVDDVSYHSRCVAAAQPSALLVADMPWLSYHVSPQESVRNAGRLVQEGRAEAVKLEGGIARLPMVEAIRAAEIPVMGHLGLTPQSVHVMGGYKVQARDGASATRLVEEALALEDAGIFALVLEGIPADVAGHVTDALEVPTIGIGAGARCDGQVLVWHDLLGLGTGPLPRFVRPQANLGGIAEEALRRFAEEVRGGTFPSEAESYRPASMESAASAVASRES